MSKHRRIGAGPVFGVDVQDPLLNKPLFLPSPYEISESMRGACNGYLPILCDSRWMEEERLVHCIAILEQRNDGDPLLKVYRRQLKEMRRIKRVRHEV